MLPDPLTDAHEWLRVAEEDLASSRVLMTSQPPLLGTASYHAQQAAEKALKAFLIARQRPLVRSHDVGALVSHCGRVDASFAALGRAAARLTPYAVLHRYPGAGDPPELSDVEQALKDAEAVVDLVRRKLARFSSC